VSGRDTIRATMATRGPQQVAELLAALTSEGYTHTRML
jgi:hypothetical protein